MSTTDVFRIAQQGPAAEEEQGRLKADLQFLRRRGLLKSSGELSYQGRKCTRCGAPFGRFYNTGARCTRCARRVCRQCRIEVRSLADNKDVEWICNVCYGIAELNAATGNWTYETAVCKGPINGKSSVSPVELLKHSIRRAWTINGPPTRWSAGRKSSELRIYRSLPSRRQEYRNIIDENEIVRPVIGEFLNSYQEDPIAHDANEQVDCYGSAKDVAITPEKSALRVETNERTSTKCAEKSPCIQEEEVPSADAIKPKKSERSVATTVGKTKVDEKEESGNGQEHTTPKISLIKPPRILSKFISPEIKFGQSKHNERKSSIPIFRRSSKEFEDIKSPQESTKRSLIPQRYRGSTDDLRRSREDISVPSLIPKLLSPRNKEDKLKRQDSKDDIRCGGKLSRRNSKEEVRGSPFQSGNKEDCKHGIRLFRRDNSREDVGRNSGGNSNGNATGAAAKGKQDGKEEERVGVSSRPKSTVQEQARTKAVLAREDRETFDEKWPRNEEEFAINARENDRAKPEADTNEKIMLDVVAVEEKLLKQGVKKSDKARKIPAELEDQINLVHLDEEECRTTESTKETDESEVDHAEADGIDLRENDKKNAADLGLGKKPEEFQVMRRKFSKEEFSKEEFSNADDTDETVNKRCSSHLSPEASPLSTRSSRYSPRESESEPTPALPRKTGDSSFASQRIRDTITRTRRESNSSARYESSGSESVRLSETGLHGYLDLERKVKFFGGTGSGAVPTIGSDEIVQRDSATSAGEDEPHNDNHGRAGLVSSQGRSMLRRRRQFDAQGSRRRGRSHARSCCTEELQGFQTLHVIGRGGRQRSPTGNNQGQDQPVIDYRRLVFISSDSSSGREEDDADSSCSSSSFLNGLARGPGPTQSIEDCDWDYFESGTLPVPTGALPVTVGQSNVATDTANVAGDWSCCPGRGSSTASCQACGGSRGANVLPVPVPIPVPVPYPVPVPAALWTGDFAVAASSMISRGSDTEPGTLRLRGDPAAPWFAWHPRFNQPLHGARLDPLTGAFDPATCTFRPDQLLAPKLYGSSSIPTTAESLQQRLCNLQLDQDEKDNATAVPKPVDSLQNPGNESKVIEQSSTKIRAKLNQQTAEKSQQDDEQPNKTKECEEDSQQDTESVSFEDSREQRMFESEDSGSSSGRSSADSSDLEDDSSSHRFSKVFVVNDDSLTSDNDIEDNEDEDADSSESAEDGVTLKRVTSVPEEEPVVLQYVRFFSEDSTFDGSNERKFESSSEENSGSRSDLKKSTLQKKKSTIPGIEGRSKGCNNKKAAVLLHHRALPEEMYIASDNDCSESHIELKSVKTLDPDSIESTDVSENMVTLDGADNSETDQLSDSENQFEPSSSVCDSNIIPDSLEVPLSENNVEAHNGFPRISENVHFDRPNENGQATVDNLDASSMVIIDEAVGNVGHSTLTDGNLKIRLNASSGSESYTSNDTNATGSEISSDELHEYEVTPVNDDDDGSSDRSNSRLDVAKGFKSVESESITKAARRSIWGNQHEKIKEQPLESLSSGGVANSTVIDSTIGDNETGPVQEMLDEMGDNELAGADRRMELATAGCIVADMTNNRIGAVLRCGDDDSVGAAGGAHDGGLKTVRGERSTDGQVVREASGGCEGGRGTEEGISTLFRSVERHPSTRKEVELLASTEVENPSTARDRDAVRGDCSTSSTVDQVAGGAGRGGWEGGNGTNGVRGESSDDGQVVGDAVGGWEGSSDGRDGSSRAPVRSESSAVGQVVGEVDGDSEAGGSTDTTTAEGIPAHFCSVERRPSARKENGFPGVTTAKDPVVRDSQQRFPPAVHCDSVGTNSGGNRYRSLVMITQEASYQPVSVITSDTTTLLQPDEVRTAGQGLAGYFQLALEAVNEQPHRKNGQGPRRPLMVKRLAAVATTGHAELEADSGLSVGSASESDDVSVKNPGKIAGRLEINEESVPRERPVNEHRESGRPRAFSQSSDDNSGSGVVILEDGLADDDSWVEEVSHDEDEPGATTATEESSEDEANNLGDREEELRGYHRQAIDFTLHTIVEESCEESETEPSLATGSPSKKQRPPSASELEKYFFFGLGGDGNNSSMGSREVDSLSETSSIYSEGLESLGQDEASGTGQGQERSTSGEGFLNSSRLEKYFLSEFLGFDQDRRDSDGSVGSDSEGRPSPEAQRRKKLVRARGTGRSHSSSLDNLLALAQSSQNLSSQNSLQDLSLSQDAQESQSEGSSTETDGADDGQTAAFGTDGQFDTVKRKKKKPRNMGTQSPRVPDDRNKTPEPNREMVVVGEVVLENEAETNHSEDSERAKTPQPENTLSSSSSPTTAPNALATCASLLDSSRTIQMSSGESSSYNQRSKQQSRDSGFVGSCDDLLQHQKLPDDTQTNAEAKQESKDGNKEKRENDGHQTSAERSSTAEKSGGSKMDHLLSHNTLPHLPNASLSRKDSFNNWSSDEETNLMMSKMRQFFKTMVANSNGPNTNPANSTGVSPAPSPRLSGYSSKARLCSSQTRTKPPQLVYFENELTRLMKTVPGIRDDQVREIVEYLSSEDTWSDSYDSSDYTSSDLEGAAGGRRSALQEQISQSCQQIISKFDTTSNNCLSDKEKDDKASVIASMQPHYLGRDTAFVYQKLVQSFTKMAGDGVSSDANSTPHSSPPLIAKVMHHIGSRLVALMHEVSEGGPAVQHHSTSWRRYSQHHRTPSSASTTEDDDSTSDSTNAPPSTHLQLPRSKSHDPLLLINNHPVASTGQEGEEREASDYERFSWRGSFESALMAADSRTKLSLLACSGDVSVSTNTSANALAMAAKRRSAGDLLFNPKSFSREQLDRVRSCGSIGGGTTGAASGCGGSVEERIWSNRRRSSVPDANTRAESGTSAGDEDTEDELEYNGESRATTLPRGMQSAITAATNSLPRLPASTTPAGLTAATSQASSNMHKAHSVYYFLPQHSGVKSARYRPPGFARNSNVAGAIGGPKRAVSAPGLQISGTQSSASKRDNSRSRRQQATMSLTSDDGSSLSEACSTPIIGAGSRTGSNHTVMDVDDMDQGLHPGHLATRGSLSSLGARSDSMASVYSGAGEGRCCRSVAVTGEVEFALQYDYKHLTFEVHVTKCKNLAPVDVKRKRSDPYVKVYLLPDKSKSGKRKTKVKKHTLNPEFNETLKFHMSLSGLETRTLWLTVWHSDMFGRNDFLGEVRMPLENKIFDDPTPKWYPLQERTEPFDDPIAYKGEVIVGLKFVPPDPTQQDRDREIGSDRAASKWKKNWSRGALHVLVKEARNLQTRGKNSGTCDPFCKSYLLPDKGRSGKQKTGVVRRSGGSPVWGHTFIYKDVSLQELAERGLELTVWDHDRIASNEFLGGVRFNLGTGKHYGKPVDWMDATGRELSLWQSMIERPNFWVEGAVTLRPNLHNHGKNNGP